MSTPARASLPAVEEHTAWPQRRRMGEAVMKTRRVFWLGAMVAAALSASPKPDDAIAPSGDFAQINWTQGYITATGYGPKQERLPAAVQRAAQRRVAMVDAQRHLAEAVQGVHVTSETTVETYQLVSDVIKTRVDAMLQNFRVVQEGMTPEGDYMVVLAVPLNGNAAAQLPPPQIPQPVDRPRDNLTDIITDPTTNTVQIQERAEEVAREQGHVPTEGPRLEVPETPPPPPDPLPARRPGPYTGLVVDTRGFKVEHAMAPKIVTSDESEVWAGRNATRDLVLDSGIVSYMTTMDMALNADISRAGNNPLVVRAIGRHGAFKANAVVSDGDAQLIITENDKSKFLDQFRVVFVVDKHDAASMRAR